MSVALKLLCAEVLVNIARGCFVLLLGMFLYLDTQSLWAFATAFVSDFFIAVIIQGYAGKIVDEYGPKKILMGISLFCAVLFIPLTYLVSIHHGEQSSTLFLILLLSLLHNAARPFIRTGIFSIVPLEFTKVQAQPINAKLSIAMQIGQVIGVVMAGVFIELLGFRVTFGLIGIVYFIASLCYLTLPGNAYSDIYKPEPYPLLALLFKLNKGHPLFIRSAFIGSVDFALVGLLNLFIAPSVQLHFEGQTRWLTFIELTFAAGAIIAGSMTTRVKIKTNQNWWVTTLGCLISATAFYLMSATMYPSVLLGLVFSMGFFITWSSVLWVTRLQQLAPKQYLGRLGAVRLIINAVFLSFCAAIVSHVADINFYHGALVGCLLSLFMAVSITLLQLANVRLETDEISVKRGIEIE